jgi:glucosyl-3-phosphoglycerate synthase
MGYIFARRDSEVIALHDCDIVTYDRFLLGRLIEPIVNPHKDFVFCKGYYARISPTEKVMKGRVTRLFVIPFVDTMADIMAERGMTKLTKFFLYKRAFKYPLAGEFSLTSRLGRGISIANDWALEVSTLSEIFHRVTLRKIAQVDLDCNYEHKHQTLSPEDARQGLHRMVVDIAKFYFNYLLSHGFCLDDNFVKAIQQTYYQNALRFVKLYADDAETNRLEFDRHEEEVSVRHFSSFLWEAWENSQIASGEALIPSWNRVIYTLPDIYSQLVEAVESDNR